MNPSHPAKQDYFSDCAHAGRTITDRPVIDAHAHIGCMSSIAHLDASAESLIQVMDRIGIDRTCLSSYWAFLGYTAQGNNELIDAVQRHPDRLFGYMSVSVGYPEVIAPELQRCYEAGLRAVKIWSYGDRPGLPYDHPHYEIVFDFANEHHLPVLAHTWGAELDHLDRAFQKYPHINWLLAHVGTADLPKYIRVANDYDHVYVETCFSRCPRGLLETLVDKVPLIKIIWGSDVPFLTSTHQIGRVLLARISESAKSAILFHNAVNALRLN